LKQKNLIKEQWWLMSCDFPDLNWARLRVYDDSSAEIFDCDGSTYSFSDEQEARWDLVEDEYQEFNDLDQDDEQDLGISLSSIKLPSGETEAELLPQMYLNSKKH
jgi:hypothetical protein